MGTMSFDSALLNTNGYEEFNLALIAGGISPNLSIAIDQELESYAEYWETETDNERPDNFFDYITWDWDGMYKEFAEGLPEMLAQAYPDLFTRDEKDIAPVVIGEVTKAHTNDPGGWGREYITATLKINGPVLKALADDCGITEIHDGEGISGFIRTAEDDYWAQIRVIRAIMQGLNDSYTSNLEWTLDEWACSDGWVGEHMDFGKWEKDL